ncbi:MAG: tRNA (adenosine(37)-N6)-threonylcarbamoyltransferase complex transferase subunit TsaD [Spirochaetota bacterium]|nr:tRNA (adenosine(37)-N6)-threonylcarbamoyltransferase complex transferase subunit TsaD [Spirochaetota bacterium]
MKYRSDVIGLGLESSCDETSASITLNGERILSNIIFSQIELHREYYGVVPEIASRAHLEVINDMIKEALHEAGVDFKDIDYVAATNRPGLVGSLLIALQSAKAISYTLQIPLIAINHLEAHLYAPFLENRKIFFPFIGLVISGGNTIIYRVNGLGELQVIGKTVDDAIGESYDKVAKYLKLGYPGGPIIEKTAKQAKNRKMIFPKILTKKQDEFRFSYSGIKTAVINYVKKNPEADFSEIAYSFQERALELIIRRIFPAARLHNIKDIVITGGVASNGRLREMLRENAREDENIIIPSPILCTDNAAMVAGLGYHYFQKKIFSDLSVDVSSRV